MYEFTTTFGNAVLAPCLATLLGEIHDSPKYGVELINLGEIGDQNHQAQGTSSDHNPFVIGPAQSKYPGKGYVRAADLGGPEGDLLALRAELHSIYLKHDARIYPYGYCKGPDSLIFDWPPGTGFHVDTGDEGHLHVSVGIKDPNDPDGWIPALDSTAPWGISQTAPLAHQGVDMAKLYTYPNDPSLKHKGAVYLALSDFGSGQIWMTDPTVLADRQKRMKAAGQDATVHASNHSRGYNGPVLGPDPEK